MICTHDGFMARSRRGWDMSALLPELAGLPDGLQLDGEIVALRHDGHPDFHSLSSRMLHGDGVIAISYFIFDVLGCEGGSTMHLPYEERRQLLEALELNGPHWRTTATFDDAALFQVMVDRGLEGVLAKRLTDPYVPGGRSWIKTKNRATARFAQERRRGQKIGSSCFRSELRRRVERPQALSRGASPCRTPTSQANGRSFKAAG